MKNIHNIGKSIKPYINPAAQWKSWNTTSYWTNNAYDPVIRTKIVQCPFCRANLYVVAGRNSDKLPVINHLENGGHSATWL